MSEPAQNRPGISGSGRLIAGGVTLGATIFFAVWWLLPQATLPPSTIPAPAISASAGPVAVPRLSPPRPSFDIVRVGADGAAIIAGRAAAEAEVSLREDGREIGHTQADEHGQWLIIPEHTLPPGSIELTVVSRLPSGETIHANAAFRADAAVRIMVPPRGAPSSDRVAEALR